MTGRYLMDTHTFLWWIGDDPRLSARAKAIIRDSNNELWFSAASAWEIAIKTHLRRISFDDDIVTLIPEQIAANGFRNLPVLLDHTLHVSKLAPVHRDPFDRILVAQASIEKMTVLTADPIFARYGMGVVW